MKAIIGGVRALRLWWWLSLHVAALLAWPLPAQAKPVPVPPMQSRVVDLTKTLKPSEAEALRRQIASIESETQAQFAVLIVPTTGEDSIEQYATRVFAAWKLGREQEDDGVLLLVALKDRRMRIEVGTGLEGAITDIQAARVIDEQMTPAFRKGEFAEGIEATLQVLSQRAGTQPSMMIAEPDTPEDEQQTLQVQEEPEESGPTGVGRVTPAGWALFGVLLWSVGVGIWHSRRSGKPKRRRAAARAPDAFLRSHSHWKLSFGMLMAPALAAAVILREPAMLFMLATMPAPLGFGLGMACARSRTARRVTAAAVLLIVLLVVAARRVGADVLLQGAMYLFAATIGLAFASGVAFGLQ